MLTNFGILKDLMIGGIPAGRLIESSGADAKDQGSAIIVLAADIPLSERQLKRLSKRSSVGLARTGSYMGSGSGELSIAFTTENKVDINSKHDFNNISVMDESHMDTVFRAAAEAVEEAVLDSMLCAPAVCGRDGHVRRSLSEYMDMLIKKHKKY